MKVAVPVGVYRVLDTWMVSRDVALRLAAMGTLLLFIALILFSGLYALITGQTRGRIDAGGFGIAMVLILALFAVHELVHGVAIWSRGGKPHFGAGIAWFLPYFYTTAAGAFSRNEFLFISLAPGAGLSLLGIAFMLAFPSLAGWAVAPLAFNLAGSVGDLWGSRILLGYPKHVYVEDHRAGVTIWGKPDDQPRRFSINPWFSKFLQGFLLTFAIVTIAGAPVVGLVARFLGLRDFAFFAPAGPLMVVHVWPHGAEFSPLGFAALGAILGAIVGFALAAVRVGRGGPRTGN